MSHLRHVKRLRLLIVCTFLGAFVHCFAYHLPPQAVTTGDTTPSPGRAQSTLLPSIYLLIIPFISNVIELDQPPPAASVPRIGLH